MRGKNRRSGGAVQMDYLINIQEIKPWSPSQSIRSLRSVMIQWENGEHSSGSTSLLSPSPSSSSVVGEGKIEFNESFKLPVTLSRDMSVRNSTTAVFQKNCLEFYLYETRRDKTVKGQLLGTAIIDLADCGILRETLSIRTPLSCQRNYKNTDQPLLFIQTEPVGKNRARLKSSLSKEVSKDNGGGDSVSALMNGEYAEEAESSTFTDDDVSSHFSVVAITTSSESSGCMPPKHGENEPAQNSGRDDKEDSLTSETRVEKLNYQSKKQAVSSNADSSLSSEENSKGRFRSSDDENLDQEGCEKASKGRNMITGVQTNSNGRGFDMYSRNATSLHSSCSMDKSPGSGSETDDKLSERCEEADKYHVKEGGSDKYYYSSLEDKHGNQMYNFDKQYHVEDESVAQAMKHQGLLSSNSYSSGGSDNGMKGNILKSERLKHVKSVRSSADSARSIGSLGGNHIPEIYPREARNAILNCKIELLENKVKMLEGELREAAAIEASLYSVVAEHGSSMSKVHAPTRRPSRLYLYTCKENLHARRSGAAKSAISGLVLVAKACGNDVPR
ncbi:hypothetical protein RJT34_30490 [Clitoria ternatea]|uniref:C2 NT-type domain-containing protein n=1 Tax=Clitoria ternatea TaxID=43366 RepID=A0AAN9ETJ5_CLITE